MRARVSAESAPTGRPRPRPAGKGRALLPTSKRYGIASSWSTGHRLQTPQKILGHRGISGQFDGPSVGVAGLRGPPRLGQQMSPRCPGRLKSLDGRIIDRVQRTKPRVGTVDLAVDRGRG